MRPERARAAEEDFRLESANWSDAEWLERERGLRELPYVGRNDYAGEAKVSSARGEIIRQDGMVRYDPRSREATEESIETRLIVRAPSFRDWSTHYHAAHDQASVDRGDSSVVEIGKKIAARVNAVIKKNPHASREELRVKANRSLDDVFRASGGAFMILANQIDGPRGPIYFIEDGSHRTAAAKLAGLPKIVVRVGYVEGDRESLERLWFDSLALMEDSARKDLMAVYDEVYPPTPEDRAREATFAAQAAERLVGRVANREARATEQARLVAEEIERDNAERQEWDDATPRFEAYRNDSEFYRVWSEEALAFLKREDATYFFEHYNGEMTPRGYLIDKDGKETSTPAIGLDASYKSPMQIRTRAVYAFERQFPERARALFGRV